MLNVLIFKRSLGLCQTELRRPYKWNEFCFRTKSFALRLKLFLVSYRDSFQRDVLSKVSVKRCFVWAGHYWNEA